MIDFMSQFNENLIKHKSIKISKRKNTMESFFIDNEKKITS